MVLAVCLLLLLGFSFLISQDKDKISSFVLIFFRHFWKTNDYLTEILILPVSRNRQQVTYDRRRNKTRHLILNDANH